MKTTIFKIDTGRIDKLINEYCSEHNKPPYLFCNEDTFGALRRENEIKPDNRTGFFDVRLVERANELRKTVGARGVISMYHGMPIYINDDLKFGEIEAR